jgi:hypothetical protein
MGARIIRLLCLYMTIIIYVINYIYVTVYIHIYSAKRYMHYNYTIDYIYMLVLLKLH